MTMPDTRVAHPYRAAENDFVLFEDAILRALPLLLRDKPQDQARTVIRNYFDKGFAVFRDRIDELHRSNRRLTPRREKELRFMLEALISAKRMLEEDMSPQVG